MAIPKTYRVEAKNICDNCIHGQQRRNYKKSPTGHKFITCAKNSTLPRFNDEGGQAARIEWLKVHTVDPEGTCDEFERR